MDVGQAPARRPGVGDAGVEAVGRVHDHLADQHPVPVRMARRGVGDRGEIDLRVEAPDIADARPRHRVQVRRAGLPQPGERDRQVDAAGQQPRLLRSGRGQARGAAGVVGDQQVGLGDAALERGLERRGGAGLVEIVVDAVEDEQRVEPLPQARGHRVEARVIGDDDGRLVAPRDPRAQPGGMTPHDQRIPGRELAASADSACRRAPPARRRSTRSGRRGPPATSPARRAAIC